MRIPRRMSGPSSNTSFFSFGPEDSFLSKSFEGLRYRKLPQSLHKLITGGKVADVHWAALGPVTESWVLSFKDSSGKNNLGWGTAIPQRLQTILSRTAPSPHLRIFLGPQAPYDIPDPWRCDSFIAWDPDFIRWGGLPRRLEDCLQSWLTPAGWKAGPPRMVTWGKRDAFFAMSEYGDVVYKLGTKTDGEETWEIFKDTVEDWKGENGFQWSDLAYMSLDCSTPDQFIAMRSDGTWAGSIDGANEDALESFALNFFARSKSSKPRSSSNPHNTSRPQTGSGSPPRYADALPNAVLQAHYERWATDTATAFTSALNATTSKSRPPKKLQIRSPEPVVPSPNPGGKLLTQFPYLPATVSTCRLPPCASAKQEPNSIRACKHDVERLLRSSGLYGKDYLRQERIRWHPDRFGRLCEEGWREVGKRMAEEMFKIIDGLIGDLERAGG